MYCAGAAVVVACVVGVVGEMEPVTVYVMKPEELVRPWATQAQVQVPTERQS